MKTTSVQTEYLHNQSTGETVATQTDVKVLLSCMTQTPLQPGNRNQHTQTDVQLTPEKSEHDAETQTELCTDSRRHCGTQTKRWAPAQTHQDDSIQDASLQGDSVQDNKVLDITGQDASIQGARGQDAFNWGATGQDASTQNATGQDAFIQSITGQDVSIQGDAGQEAFIWGASGQDVSIQSDTGQDASIWGATGQDTSIWGASGQDASIWGATGQDVSIQGATDQDVPIQGTSGQDAFIQGITGQFNVNSSQLDGATAAMTDENIPPDNPSLDAQEWLHSQGIAITSEVYSGATSLSEVGTISSIMVLLELSTHLLNRCQVPFVMIQ